MVAALQRILALRGTSKMTKRFLRNDYKILGVLLQRRDSLYLPPPKPPQRRYTLQNETTQTTLHQHRLRHPQNHHRTPAMKQYITKG
jgi:hypothetical protein